jgi:hypothetical protein
MIESNFRKPAVTSRAYTRSRDTERSESWKIFWTIWRSMNCRV